MTGIISNVVVGIAILLCIAAAIFAIGFENGWFDNKTDRKENSETDKTKESEE